MSTRTDRRPQTNAAVAYVRVSTDEQALEGVSLDAQQARLRAYCTMRGLDLVEVVIDAAVSAGKPLAEREGGRRILDLVARRRVSAVVAWKLDRLFRDCADCLTVTRTWDSADVALHLVDLGGQAVDTRSAMGRFFVTIMAGAAELERNQIRERTSAAMRHMQSRGEYIGGEAPFGFRLTDDGTLAPVPAEKAAIEEARRLRHAGLSLRAVAAELDRAGVRARNGKIFAASQVARMVA